MRSLSDIFLPAFYCPHFSASRLFPPLANIRPSSASTSPRAMEGGFPIRDIELRRISDHRRNQKPRRRANTGPKLLECHAVLPIHPSPSYPIRFELTILGQYGQPHIAVQEQVPYISEPVQAKHHFHQDLDAGPSREKESGWSGSLPRFLGFAILKSISCGAY
jgi:hypothetical protein